MIPALEGTSSYTNNSALPSERGGGSQSSSISSALELSFSYPIANMSNLRIQAGEILWLEKNDVTEYSRNHYRDVGFGVGQRDGQGVDQSLNIQINIVCFPFPLTEPLDC